MDDLHFRAATLEDIPQLLTFEQGVISAERPYNTNLNPDPINYYGLEQLINSEQVYLAVAEYNGEIVACGYARIEQSKPYVNYRFYSYLGFMYVKPENRGQGINQKVIDELARWSTEQGITIMHLDVYANNSSALQAYKKAGFKENLIDMKLDISLN